MKTPDRLRSRWWKNEGSALAGAIVAICNTQEAQDSFRRVRYQECLTYYEGRPVSLETADGYYITSLSAVVQGQPMYNLSRSACDSVKADIAGRQKPKPMFVTTGGDWRARRRARKLDKFVEGQMSQRQGRYANTWDLMIDVFHDSAKLGVGIAKVSPDTEHKKVQLERIFPWEIFVDKQEARYGSPQNMFHVYPMEIDIAVELFVEMNEAGDAPKDDENAARLAAIEGAERPRYETGKVIESIKIREAWRLPFSEDSPGKHVICVNNAVLFEEDWEEPEFPFVILTWEKDTVGFWAQGIVEAHRSQHLETNRAATALNDRMRICTTKRTYYDPDVVTKAALEEGGSSEMLIASKDMSRNPQESPVNPATAQEFQWVQINIDRYFTMSGVSQQSAASQKSKGLTAAVAIEAENDLGTQRFMPKARGYEESFVQLGRLFVRAADKVAEAHGGYLVRWPGKRFIQQLNWNDVSIEDMIYEIRVAAVSMFSKDPAQMLQVAQDLHAGGIINRETFLQMTSLPDLEGLMNRETAEREWLEELFSRYLDSEDDDQLLELGGYEAPEPFMTNKPAAMWLVVSTYWEAKRDGAPMFCLELLQRWITQLDKLIAPSPPPTPPGGLPMPEAPGALPMAGGAGPEAPGGLPAGVVLPQAA